MGASQRKLPAKLCADARVILTLPKSRRFRRTFPRRGLCSIACIIGIITRARMYVRTYINTYVGRYIRITEGTPRIIRTHAHVYACTRSPHTYVQKPWLLSTNREIVNFAELTHLLKSRIHSRSYERDTEICVGRTLSLYDRWRKRSMNIGRNDQFEVKFTEHGGAMVSMTLLIKIYFSRGVCWMFHFVRSQIH